MAKIKFSHEYKKMRKQTQNAELIALRLAEYQVLTPELIKYDTETIEGKFYELPKTKLIKLFFDGDKGIPYCTLRRYTPEKWKYYESLIGKVLVLEIKER